MKQRRAGSITWGLVLGALIALLGCGCASSWRQASRGGGAVTGSGGAVASEPRVDAELDQRAEAYARYASGVVFSLRDDPARAEESFRLSLEADPANETLAIELALRYLQRREADEARKVLLLAIKEPEATGMAHAWLGKAYVELERPGKAASAFEQAILKSPDVMLGYQGLAQIHLEKGEPREALAVWDRAIERPEIGAAFLVALAESMAEAGQAKTVPMDEVKPRVLGLLERVAALEPNEPFLLEKMAQTYRNVGEVALANELYSDLLDKHAPDNPALAPVLRERLARYYLMSGDTQRAVRQLRELLNVTPTNARAHFLLGSVAGSNGDPETALTHLTKAILLDPDLEPAYYDLGALLIGQGRPEEALEVLNRARHRFASGFYLEFYTGVAHAALEQYYEALKAYTSAEVAASATDPSRLTHVFYFQVGATSERLGHYQEAEQYFRKCLELAPESAEAMNYLGYMWAERGEHLEEAHDLIERALKLEPENAAFLDSMAWVLFMLGKPAEALPYMLKAIALEQREDVTLWDHLGDIHAALGNIEAARNAWGKALELDPKQSIREKLEGLPNDDSKS